MTAGDRESDDAAASDAERFTDRLRAGAEPDWTAATTHRFTGELGADTLDDDAFRRYLVQDYAFLDALVGAFGYAVGQAPTRAAQSTLTDFLGTLTAEENDYFERSFEALGVPPETYEDPATTPPTRAFRDLLGRATREGGYAETLAVLVPAEWIYRSWATAAAEAHDRPDRFYLAEWIDLHANPDFEAFVDWLRAELDREGETFSARRRRRVAALFERTVELEVAFFDAAYETGDGESRSRDGDATERRAHDRVQRDDAHARGDDGW